MTALIGGSFDHSVEMHEMVSHALRGEGFDASKDGTGRGTPLVPVGVTLHGSDGTVSAASYTDVSGALRARTPGGVENSSTTAVLAFQSRASAHQSMNPSEVAPTMEVGKSDDIAVTVAIPIHDKATRHGGHSQDRENADGNGNGLGVGQQGDPMFTVTTGDKHAVLVGVGGTDVGYALRSGASHSGDKGDKGDGGVNCTLVAQTPAIGWSEELTPSLEVAGTIQRGGDGGRHEGVMTPTMAVRRLTPRECCRLQGFPDDYLDIIINGKPAADGPKYKSLGNSMAVPCMIWIGSRIQMVEEVLKESETPA